MLETKSKQIGQCTYRVTQLGALKGSKIMTRLLKVAGPAMGAITEGGISDALSKLADSLEEEDVSYLCEEFAKRTEVELPNGKAPQLSDIFDSHFAGEYGDLIRWLVFCLEVNFSSFFAELVSTTKGAKAADSSSKKASP